MSAASRSHFSPRGCALALAGALALIAVAALGDAAPVFAQIAVKNQGYVPYSDAPIHYRTAPLHDPVARLQSALDSGAVTLSYDPDHGYLNSVLALLHVPASSQTLVFSKTSFQYSKISPDHPRALYYNDDVYVGSVHDGKAVEIVSFDPMQGAIFYLLDEHQTDKPVFQRAELDCTQCHIAAATRGIPGVLLRSVFPTPSGTLTPRAPTAITDQTSPLAQRWGGWYVSGDIAGQTMANRAVFHQPEDGDGQLEASALTLDPFARPFDASLYLKPTSDPVALLVLAHQTQMHNLITLTNYQTRLALFALPQKDGENAPSLDALPDSAREQITRPAEQLLRYLLFVHEAPLGDARKLRTSSQFARDFEARGPRDSQGRSLRDFDLNNRIFRFPCSYLIYSTAFDALPDPAKTYVYHRLLEILSGQDKSPDFAGLSAADRQNILAILLETKPNLPAEWQAYARVYHLRLAPNTISTAAD